MQTHTQHAHPLPLRTSPALSGSFWGGGGGGGWGGGAYAGVGQAAAARYEQKKQAVSREIRAFEEDATRTREEKNDHYERRQAAIMESNERADAMGLQHEVRERKAALDGLTEAYVNALKDQHDAASTWSEARGVIVAAGSVASVVGAIIITPLVTMASTGYRINKTVDAALEKERAQLQDLLMSSL